jgi:hypothetical protein
MAFTFSKLTTVTVDAGGTTAIDFTNIPQNYKDLCLKFSLRAGENSTQSRITFNNDNSTSNYSQRRLYGYGSTVTSDNSTNLGYLSPIGSTTSTQTANTFANSEMYIPNYTASLSKSVSFDAVVETNDVTTFVTFTAGLWSQTSAITSIRIVPASTSFVQYSTATLYGIRAEV